jgi:hypothetical protein
MITNPNIQILEIAGERLKTLTEEMVFVNGCATGLLLTDPAASTVRPTIDVYVVVEVATLVEYYRISELCHVMKIMRSKPTHITERLSNNLPYPGPPYGTLMRGSIKGFRGA